MKKNTNQEDTPMKRNTIEELEVLKGGFVGYLRDRNSRPDTPAGSLSEQIRNKKKPSPRTVFGPLVGEKEPEESSTARRMEKTIPVFIPSVEAKMRALSGIEEPEVKAEPEVETETAVEPEVEESIPAEELLEEESEPFEETGTEPETTEVVTTETETVAAVESEPQPAEAPVAEADPIVEEEPEVAPQPEAEKPAEEPEMEAPAPAEESKIATQYLICKVCGTIINVLNAERNARCCRQLMVPLSQASDDNSPMEN